MSQAMPRTIGDLIAATIADYERRGAAAIADLCTKRPVAFVQLVAAVSGLIQGSEPVWEETDAQNGS
jgi:hypothetical protein